MVDVMCKMCRAGHQLENRVVIAREALRILALGVLSVMATTSEALRRRPLQLLLLFHCYLNSNPCLRITVYSTGHIFLIIDLNIKH